MIFEDVDIYDEVIEKTEKQRCWYSGWVTVLATIAEGKRTSEKRYNMFMWQKGKVYIYYMEKRWKIPER